MTPHVTQVNIMRQTLYALECLCWIPDKDSHIYLHTDSRPAIGANQVFT